MLIDTHCHLDDPLLQGRLAGILSAALKCGVTAFIVPGVHPAGWDGLVALAEGNPRISIAPGVHPMAAASWDHTVAGRLQSLLPGSVAVGEIGLDYSDGMPPRGLQKEVFRAQLQLAGVAGLPVIIHCRRAFADTLQILAAERAGGNGGVMHAFSGSVEIARACIALGLRIGIAGSVTWGNAVRPVQVVEAIPLEHLLLETDSPDLPPEPHRGETNEPAFLAHIVERMAAIKAVPAAAVAAATTNNARAVFGLRC